MPEHKKSPAGLEGSSEETLAAVASMGAEADDAEERLRKRLLKDAEQTLADAQEPGEA